MQCTKPINLTKNVDRIKYPDGLKVPCGKCLQCRIQKRKEWAMRCLHELDNHYESVFVTLTYDDKHLPKNGSLQKKELQKFFKRLRQWVWPYKIRYFACGEYGDEKERPHYHAIIYGIGLKEEQKAIIKRCWPFCDWTVQKIADSSFGCAEPDSIRYVAQYIDKKLSGEEAKKEYTDKGREPVFKVQSLGIGRCYVEKNKDQLERNESITMFGVKQTMPRYYLNLTEIDKEALSEKAVQKEMDIVKELTGRELTEIELYKSSSAKDFKEYHEKLLRMSEQREKNAKAKIDMKKKSL